MKVVFFDSVLVQKRRATNFAKDNFKGSKEKAKVVKQKKMFLQLVQIGKVFLWLVPIGMRVMGKQLQPEKNRKT